MNSRNLGQLLDILRLQPGARGIDARCIELGEVEVNLAEARRTITIKQGIEHPVAKKLIAGLKEAKLKVEGQINDNKLRVTGKKRDDLQAAMALLRKSSVELPLQFEGGGGWRSAPSAAGTATGEPGATSASCRSRHQPAVSSSAWWSRNTARIGAGMARNGNHCSGNTSRGPT